MELELTSEIESSNNKILKTIPIIRDLGLNPSCDHGPTILFEKDKDRYFSCSAFRSRKICPFYMSEKKWKELSNSKGKPGDSSGVKNNKEKTGLKRKLSSTVDCPKIVKPNSSTHPLVVPNQRNKGEAQYHFNNTTVKFFMDQFRNLGIDSVLCVGTPSLHEYILKSGETRLKSFLLDIDQRFIHLYSTGFELYNMCNHYFFQDSFNYQEFIKSAKKLAIFVDPPFGVKVEIIWNGCISGIKKDFAGLQNTNHDDGNRKSESNSNDIDVFWVYPYYMEGHILGRCGDSNLNMSDFHVEYRNHPKLSGSKYKGSPVRLYTTVPLSNLTLPDAFYRYCDICAKWVAKENAHCNLCGTCTTKDGGRTYVHCHKCKKCVKPTWKHCACCKACHLEEFSGGQHSTDHHNHHHTTTSSSNHKQSKSLGNDRKFTNTTNKKNRRK